MKDFILKGNVLYSQSKDEIRAFENAYVVCKDGVCKGIFGSVPDKFKDLEVIAL